MNSTDVTGSQVSTILRKIIHEDAGVLSRLAPDILNGYVGLGAHVQVTDLLKTTVRRTIDDVLWSVIIAVYTTLHPIYDS